MLQWAHLAGLGGLWWLTLVHEDEFTYTNASGYSVEFREFLKTDFYFVLITALVGAFFLLRGGYRLAYRSPGKIYWGHYLLWGVLEFSLVFMIVVYMALA